MHATIDWSYRLLNDTERVLFERLAVFAGSCDLEAIEAVCCDPPLERDDVDSLLAALVDKSLVTAHRIGDVTRFRLLETIRQFAEERLEDSGQHRAMRAAHLMHYRNAALVAGARYGGPDERDAVARLRGDWDDIRAALDDAIGTADVASAAELVAAPFWYAWHEMRSELGHWAERALRMMTDMPAEPTPDVYGVAAAFAVNAGEMERGRDLARQGIRAAAQSGQPPPFICLLFFANSYFYAGQRAEAWEALLVCDEHTSKHGTPYEQFFVTLPLTGYSAIVSPADTPDHAARGQRLAWRLDAPTPLAIAQWEAACAAWSSGDLHPALDTFERARREAESLGATWLVGLTLSSAIIRLAGDPGDEPFTRQVPRDHRPLPSDPRMGSPVGGAGEPGHPLDPARPDAARRRAHRTHGGASTRQLLPRAPSRAGHRQPASVRPSSRLDGGRCRTPAGPTGPLRTRRTGD